VLARHCERVTSTAVINFLSCLKLRLLRVLFGVEDDHLCVERFDPG
jgi:hypothetical protein